MCEVAIKIVSLDGLLVEQMEELDHVLAEARTIAKLDGCQLNGVVVNRWDSWIPTWLERSMGLER